MTVEKLLGVETPKRVDYMRIIVMELARISDHLICNGILGVDTGAFTGFLYLMQEREHIYEIYEEICGARLTTNIGRIGGLERDFSHLKEGCLDFIDTLWSAEGGFHGHWADDHLDAEYTFYGLLALGHLSL